MRDIVAITKKIRTNRRLQLFTEGASPAQSSFSLVPKTEPRLPEGIK